MCNAEYGQFIAKYLEGYFSLDAQRTTDYYMLGRRVRPLRCAAGSVA